MPRKKKLVHTESVEPSPSFSVTPILQLRQFKPEKAIVEHIDT